MKKIKLFFVLLVIVIFLFFAAFRVVQKIYYPLNYVRYIEKYSNKYNVDPYLISAVIYEESRFRPAAYSKRGAIGLMQIIPSTASWISKYVYREKIKTSSLYQPEKNIELGVWYLNYLEKKYGRDDLVLAAYNSGYKNVDKWLNKALIDGKSIDEIEITFTETRQFIDRVKQTRAIYENLYQGVFTQ